MSLSKIFGSKGKPKDTPAATASPRQQAQPKPRPPLWNGDVTVITPDPPDRNWNKVIDYAGAGPELRAEMEKIIAPLAQNPADIAAIRAYGAAEMERAANMGIYILGLCEKSDQISQRVLEGKLDDVDPRRKTVIKALHPYLGAGKEIIRRYEEDYIPAAQAKAGSSGALADAKRAKDVTNGLEEFCDRLALIADMRIQIVVAINLLRNAALSPGDGSSARVPGQMKRMRSLTADALAAQYARADAAAAATVLTAPMRVCGPLKLKPPGPGGTA